MTERISRKDDEPAYQPRLHSRWISELWRLSQEKGLPMTVILEEAVKEYVLKEEECVTHTQPPETP
jgi:hypothetical protein